MDLACADDVEGSAEGPSIDSGGSGKESRGVAGAAAIGAIRCSVAPLVLECDSGRDGSEECEEPGEAPAG